MPGVATRQEAVFAAKVTQSVIAEIEGDRVVVLGEVMGMLGAWYMAQCRLRGGDPEASLRQFLASVGECAVHYDDIGIMQMTQ